MASNIISDERYLEINNPKYIYTCKKCSVPKPNTEYSEDKSNKRGRRYVTQCKECRNAYSKSEKVLSRKRVTAPVSRKKNRISSIYWSSITNSKNRNLEHTITKEDLNELFNIQKGLCYYTKQPMLRDITDAETNDDSVSLDRFDSSKGYIKGNVVLCKWIVNRMKNDLTFEKFLQVISQINSNFNK